MQGRALLVTVCMLKGVKIMEGNKGMIILGSETPFLNRDVQMIEKAEEDRSNGEYTSATRHIRTTQVGTYHLQPLLTLSPDLSS